MFFKNVKAKTLWILSIVMFLAVIGLIIATLFTKEPYNKILIGVTVVMFLMITLTVQSASFKTFSGKTKKKNYTKKEFETSTTDIIKRLEDMGFKKRERRYGYSFIKVEKPNAFKVNVVTDIEAYLNVDPKESPEQDDPETAKKLDQCDRMIGFEMFDIVTEEYLSKIADFTIQAGNIYYTAFVKKENGNYLCLNYEAANENHLRNYDRLLEMLDMKEIKVSE